MRGLSDYALGRCYGACYRARESEAAAWDRLRRRTRRAFGPIIVATRDAQA